MLKDITYRYILYDTSKANFDLQSVQVKDLLLLRNRECIIKEQDPEYRIGWHVLMYYCFNELVQHQKNSARRCITNTNITISSSKGKLLSPCYVWKTAHLTLNNNQYHHILYQLRIMQHCIMIGNLFWNLSSCSIA